MASFRTKILKNKLKEQRIREKMAKRERKIAKLRARNERSLRVIDGVIKKRVSLRDKLTAEVRGLKVKDVREKRELDNAIDIIAKM